MSNEGMPQGPATAEEMRAAQELIVEAGLETDSIIRKLMENKGLLEATGKYVDIGNFLAERLAVVSKGANKVEGLYEEKAPEDKDITPFVVHS